MKQDKSRPKESGSLRKQAEKALAAKSGKIRKKPDDDMEKVVHELQVHQIELEMQNDELRKAQREIEESRTKYFELYDLAPVCYFTLNQKGIIKEANLSGAKLLNTPKSVLLLKPFFLFVPRESRDIFYAHLKKVFTSGAKQTCELELMSKEGSFPVLMESIAINGKDPDFSQCLLMVRDVTEQRQAEKEVLRVASKYRSLFANMINGFAYHQIVLNRNGKPVDYIFLEINNAFEKLTGLKRENIIGKKATEVIPGIENDPAGWINTYGEVALSGKEIRFENYSEALGKWYCIAAYSPEKGYFVSVFDDITERKRTEEALHDIRSDLNRAQSVANIGSWRLDVRQNELLWSEENWRIFGVPKGTALTYETFLSVVHPDDREYVDKQWKAALQGEPYDIEHRIFVNGQVKWVHERAKLEFDKDGMLQGGFGTTQDVTEKKQAEKEVQTLMEELKRSNADLEQFAYAASHDLQEPLRVVAGFVGLLEKRYKDKLDDKAYEFIEYALEGVKRMQVLIKDLLAYSQVGTKTKTFKPTICSVALEQAIYNLHSAIEESGAEITYDFLPTVSADTSQLTRLFQNLIGNAIKFRGKDRLKIHIAAEQKGNEWVFSIQDNGIGIDPKFFDRIFVVFQRLHTREKYEGTGIGLAVCKKIVERHGGHIRVESEPCKGTTFYFTIPVME